MRTFAVGHEGTRDATAQADGFRVVNCPVKSNEPIAAQRCVEAQTQGCYCPTALGALRGAEEALSVYRPRADDTEDAPRREKQLAQIRVLKKRAADLGPNAYAGPAVPFARKASPPPAPALKALPVPASKVWKAPRCTTPGCGRRVSRRGGKLVSDVCSKCRRKAARTRWGACGNADRGCKGRIDPKNRTHLCANCACGRVKHLGILTRKCTGHGCRKRLQSNSTGDLCFSCRSKAGETSKNKARNDFRRAEAQARAAAAQGVRLVPTAPPAPAAFRRSLNPKFARLNTRELSNLLVEVKREIEHRNRAAGGAR